MTFERAVLEALKKNQPRIGDLDVFFAGNGSRASEAVVVAHVLAHARVGQPKTPFFSEVLLLVPPGADDDFTSPVRDDPSVAPVNHIALKAASWPLVLSALATMNTMTAVVIACSELPRSPRSARAAYSLTGAQTPFGEVWRVGALEDEWVNHLVDFARKGKEIAQQRHLYLLLHVGQPFPSSDQNRRSIYDACDSFAQVGSPHSLAGAPPNALPEWARQVHLGNVDAVLADIAKIIPGRINIALTQIQVLAACGLDSEALSLAKPLIKDIEALGEASADALLARVWLNNGHGQKCREHLEQALSRGYLDELSLRTILGLTQRLDDDGLQQKAEELLVQRYPDSRQTAARQVYRLMAAGDYETAAQLTANRQDDDLLAYLHRVCTHFHGTPTSLTTVVEQVAQALPEFRAHAIADCLAYAVRSKALLVGAEFLSAFVSEEAVLEQHARDAVFLLRLLFQQRNRASDDLEEVVDAALRCLDFVVTHLALNPSSVVRASLASTLLPEGSGYLGQLVILRALKGLQREAIEPSERSYGMPATAAEFAEFLSRYVAHRAGEKQRLLVGRYLNEEVVRPTSAPSLLVAVLQQITFSVDNLSDIDGERAFDLMLFVALDLAATCDDVHAAGIALSLGATALAAAGRNQRARDLTEHGLFLARQSADRRRRAWITFADVYCRCKNPIEAAIGWLAAAKIYPENLSRADAFNEATVVVRLLRDLHEPNEALAALNAARGLADNADDRLRLDHLEGMLLLLTASTEEPPAAGQALVRLLTFIVERLMGALKQGDAPVVLLAGEALRLARRLGIAGSSELTRVQSALDASPMASPLSMLAHDDAPADAMLEQLLRLSTAATSSGDRARDAYNLALFARRQLERLASNTLDMGSALVLLECCLSHSVSSVEPQRPRSDALREQVRRKRLEEHIREPGRNISEFASGPLPLGALVESPATLTAIEQSLRQQPSGSVDIEYLVLDEDQQLASFVVHEGTLSGLKIEPAIRITTVREWLLEYPHGLEDLRGPGALNQLDDALAPIHLRREPSERLTVFVCDSLIARVPHHLFKLNPHSRVRAPCAVVPSLSWLGSSLRSPAPGNGNVCAWILPPDQDAAISALLILKTALEDLQNSSDLALAIGPILPSHLRPLDLLVVAGHGGLGVEERFFVTAAGEDGTQHTSSTFAANLAGSRVVVLLVCSGGRVDVDPFSDRLVGMHVELLDRGVRTVVASPWKLQSTSAAEWIRHFLHAWRLGRIVAQCVFDANEALTQAGEPADYLAMHVYGDPFQRRAPPP